ncbi:Pre-mRNA cleavage complex II protein Clp1-domain-containing protein [Syncephalis fuscata]|nr:Pre-mRNA cleavage complex II protein Clp1-domain-containing protein [Syncephalis fuscata]
MTDPSLLPINASSNLNSGNANRKIKLEAENELRLEVEFGYNLTLKMTEGTAEIFGCELMVDKEYRFSGQKLAIFTWQGCTIELNEISLRGADYVADDTPMPMFLNIHTSLEERRVTAAVKIQKVVLVGAPDSGKTSLAKILLNYAVRQGRQPMFVSLDTADGGTVMPGAISTAMVDLPVYPEEELGSIGLDLTASGGSRAPVAYYYGFDSPQENPKLLYKLISKMATTVDARLNEDQEALHSGMIVDTNGCVEHGEFELLLHIIQSFSADVVLVLGHERLHSDLTRSLSNSSQVTILKLTKLGGVARRDKSFLRQSQMRRIREYFYGHPGQCELSPFSLVISFNDVRIYRVGEENVVPSSALPLGADRKSSSERLVPIEAGDILLHSILAIVDATGCAPIVAPDSSDGTTATTDTSTTAITIHTHHPEEEEKLVMASVLGFVYVSDVNTTKRKMTVLTPSASRLPSNRLVMGAFKWAESI